MTHQIWKFPISIEGETVLLMPDGAETLTVQAQYSKIAMWAVVDPSKPKVERTFISMMTGVPWEEDLYIRYIGTVQISPLVFHVFEKYTGALATEYQWAPDIKLRKVD